VGIGVTPHLVMAAQSGCVRLLPQHEAPSRTIWLAVHGDLRHVPRVRAVGLYCGPLFGEPACAEDSRAG
jgi:DNA-binding transcriptional LysR family regulator